MRRVPAETLLLGTVLLWSFNFTAIRYGLTNGFEPLAFAPLRWVLAGATLTALALWRGHSLRVGRRDLMFLAGAATIGIVLNQIAFAHSVRLISASTVALIFGTLPIFISLIAHLSGTERLQARHWLATGISFSGVALVAVGASGGLSANISGIGLALFATSSFALFCVILVPLMRRHSPLAVNAITGIMGAIGLCVVSSTALAGHDWGAPNALAWSALVYGAVISIGLGNVLWFTAIDRVGPGRASLFGNLQPFLGALFAVIVLSESLSISQLVGGFVIGAGIVLGRQRLTVAPSE